MLGLHIVTVQRKVRKLLNLKCKFRRAFHQKYKFYIKTTEMITHPFMGCHNKWV